MPNPVTEFLADLADQFPHSFVREGHLPHRPLKLGIHRDLAARCPAVQPPEIALALRCYTARLKYLAAAIAGAVRVDLDGEPAGAVTADEAAVTAARLANLLARRQAQWDATSASRPPDFIKVTREVEREFAKVAGRTAAPIEAPSTEPIAITEPEPGPGRRRPILHLPKTAGRRA